MKRASQIINDIQNNKADSLFLDIYQDESMIEFQKKSSIKGWRKSIIKR